ncbi:MAG: hypothetical protein HUU07_13700 [Candidatus Brocadia sinica]|nr:hypothetical protein [Candidatus Brocadia sinica]
MRKGFWRMMGVPLFILGLLYTTQVKADAPAIHIWYGHHQVFGRFGLPQRWVNILGNVSDPDGITSLNYSLNGRPEQPLSLGPDKRRLVSPGDFNIEIAYADLIIGQNQVVIKATDSLGNQTIETVTVECTKGNAWPLPYAINWSSVEKIQDVAQIVDGLWFLDKNGIRTHPDHVGYDRIVAIGDMRWTDYEVTVPVTIHAIDESAFDSSTSVGPGLGVLFRWQGHTNLPVVCPQPHCGWEPAGGSNWYEWKRNQRNLLHIHAGPGNPPDSPSPSTDTHQFETGHTYWFKARVETNYLGQPVQGFFFAHCTPRRCGFWQSNGCTAEASNTLDTGYQTHQLFIPFAPFSCFFCWSNPVLNIQETLSQSVTIDSHCNGYALYRVTGRYVHKFTIARYIARTWV